MTVPDSGRGEFKMRKYALKIATVLALVLMWAPLAANAANDKIDPATYLCAELVSNELALRGELPIFEGLQIDGYVGAKIDNDMAAVDTVNMILQQAVMWCQDRPTDTVISVWEQMRVTGPTPKEGWLAKSSTCADYALNPDDASGFIIWLDGYNRKLSDTDKSILNTDEDVQAFIDACMISPKKTMLEVLQETAK